MSAVSSITVIGIAALVWCDRAFAEPTLAQPEPVRQMASDAALIMLDIPAQPLEQALKSLAAAAQVELFYESAVVASRRSSPVRGRFSKEQAMNLLLQGTGLSSASFEPGSITILARPDGRDGVDIARARAELAEFSTYLAGVQASMDRAFCRLPVAAADPDELLARLWISSSGRISKAELRSSVGSDQRDRVYLAALAGLSIDGAPPLAMPQPVNLMIMPKQSHAAATCIKYRSELRHSDHE